MLYFSFSLLFSFLTPYSLFLSAKCRFTVNPSIKNIHQSQVVFIYSSIFPPTCPIIYVRTIHPSIYPFIILSSMHFYPTGPNTLMYYCIPEYISQFLLSIHPSIHLFPFPHSFTFHSFYFFFTGSEVTTSDHEYQLSTTERSRKNFDVTT